MGAPEAHGCIPNSLDRGAWLPSKTIAYACFCCCWVSGGFSGKCIVQLLIHKEFVEVMDFSDKTIFCQCTPTKVTTPTKVY